MTREQKKIQTEELNAAIKDQPEYTISEIKKYLITKPELYAFFQKEGDNCSLVKLDKKYEGVEKGFIINWIHASEMLIRFEKHIKDAFPNYKVLENLNLFMRLSMSSNYKLSQIFGYLQKNRHMLNVEEYNVKQMSLEQIFLSFAEESKSK